MRRRQILRLRNVETAAMPAPEPTCACKLSAEKDDGVVQAVQIIRKRGRPPKVRAQ